MPRRIKYKKGGKLPPNTVYVGRPTIFGNPFKVGRGITQEEAVRLYDEWLSGRLQVGNDAAKKVLSSLHELKGKNLSCWCDDDKPCHADVLLREANK